MAPMILGLDIGGANLKAATADQRAVSVSFALWKQPNQLPAALAELVGQFPGAAELAVTMTGELCDCYETKRQGVNAILDAVEFAAQGKPVRAWSTDGEFVTVAAARRDHLKAAASNWLALATFAARFAPNEPALLIDIGSTTTDIIPLLFGTPRPQGRSDPSRLVLGELVYCGVRRTPVCAVAPDSVCAELFATTQDVFVVLGLLPEEPENRDTADGRPLTIPLSQARLARMLGGDTDLFSPDEIAAFARSIAEKMCSAIAVRVDQAQQLVPGLRELQTVVVSGVGEFLAHTVLGDTIERVLSLNDELGPTVSACAPAYAVAVLATERYLAQSAPGPRATLTRPARSNSRPSAQSGGGP